MTAGLNGYAQQEKLTVIETGDSIGRLLAPLDSLAMADAEKLAEQAGENYYLDNNKKGFYASPEEIQKATAALNRQRETLIKTIQTKKANGDATKEEEKKLADLTKKLKDLKFEQDNLNMSQE